MPTLSSLLRISGRSTACRSAENRRSSWSGFEPEPVEVILESLPKYCFVPARAVSVRRVLVRSPRRRSLRRTRIGFPLNAKRLSSLLTWKWFARFLCPLRLSPGPRPTSCWTPGWFGRWWPTPVQGKFQKLVELFAKALFTRDISSHNIAIKRYWNKKIKRNFFCQDIVVTFQNLFKRTT